MLLTLKNFLLFRILFSGKVVRFDRAPKFAAVLFFDTYFLLVKYLRAGLCF